MNGTSESHIFYQQSVVETLKNLHTKHEGLDDAEVQSRFKIYGENKLIVSKRESLLVKALNQFKDLMVVILTVAGFINLYLESYRDAIILFAIVLINATISFFQEYRAEKLMDSLKTLVHAEARVMRNGDEIEINSAEIVPGDILVLAEGDAVPADARVIQENTLGTNDFALTGESNPTRKFTHAIRAEVPLGDRNNLVFMGTTVATGNALAVVVATGMQTEIGRIANMSQQTVTQISPLQKELNHLSKILTAITLVISAVLFAYGLYSHLEIREAFIFSLGIAAALVPEGLPAQVSIALSLAAARLAKERALVKKLSAVETLGSTHIICTDKTGTLTKNEMTVQKILLGMRALEVSGLGYEAVGNILDEKAKPLSEEELKKYMMFFEIGVFASNACVNPPDDEHQTWYSIGDPTEAALITLAAKAGLDPEAHDKKYPELKEFTFDSVRKRMSSIRQKDGVYGVYVKGAPQNILPLCTHILDNGVERPITPEDIHFIESKDDEYAVQALRNLGYAYKTLPEFHHNIEMEDAESGLTWVGMVSIIDPPREDVKEAMDVALKAHIRVIIITGDYALTAQAIAIKIGLNSNSENKEITVVNGQDLKNLSDIDLLHKLIYTNLIFSRTAPEDKLRIVGLLKKAGEIVAVTGDGVNDAPALKKADIGVAMGKVGTEVAKDSAEIVLLDDSFATLVTAIREGRIIFQNLKKTILSSLTSNGGELFAVIMSLIGTTIFHYPLAILAVQILAIDLVGEMLPLTFLTWDPAQPRIMTEAPRNTGEHIMNKHSLFDLAWSGLIMGGIGYANFLFLFYRENVSPIGIASDNLFYMRATTLTYITIVFVQWANIMSRRAGGREFVLSSYLWSNKRLLLGFGISLFFLLNIVYNPFISQYIGTAPMTLIDWLYAIAGGLIYLIIREVHKVFRKRHLVELNVVPAK